MRENNGEENILTLESKKHYKFNGMVNSKITSTMYMYIYIVHVNTLAEMNFELIGHVSISLRFIIM